MIHDVFFRRYPQTIFYSDSALQSAHALSVQVAHIIISDLEPELKYGPRLYQDVHDALAREFGVGKLADAQTWRDICIQF